jgi:EAL domain-containing protein (putative c-di-GMP-specific phosphodiesterase class I)
LKRVQVDAWDVECSSERVTVHDDAAIVTAIVAMAQSLTPEAPVAGVETARQAACLRLLRSNLVKCLHFGQPIASPQRGHDTNVRELVIQAEWPAVAIASRAA